MFPDSTEERISNEKASPEAVVIAASVVHRQLLFQADFPEQGGEARVAGKVGPPGLRGEKRHE